MPILTAKEFRQKECLLRGVIVIKNSIDLVTPASLVPLTRHLASEVEALLKRLNQPGLLELAQAIAVSETGHVTLHYVPTERFDFASPPSPAQRAHYARLLLEGIDSAHKLGLTHGQIDWTCLRWRNGQPTLMGMGQAQIQIPESGRPRPGTRRDHQSLGLLLLQILCWQRDPSEITLDQLPLGFEAAIRELTQDDEALRHSAVLKLVDLLYRTEADLLPEFGCLLSDRYCSDAAALPADLRGRLKVQRKRTKPGEPEEIEVFSSKNRYVLSAQASGQYLLTYIGRGQQPRASQHLRQMALQFRLGVETEPLLRALDQPSQVAELSGPLDQERVNIWPPYRIGEFVHQEQQEEFREKLHYVAVVSPVPDDRKHEIVVRLENVRSVGGKKNTKWRRFFRAAEDITLRTARRERPPLRAQGKRFEAGQLVIEMSRGQLVTPRHLELVHRGEEARLEREELALKDFCAGKAVNPRLPHLLLNPAIAECQSTVPVERLYQKLEPPEEVKALLGRILGAPDVFALQGPPGTGKTTIITEVILHELERNPNARILVTSQGRDAVRNVFERLNELKSSTDIELPTRFLTYQDDRQLKVSPDFQEWVERTRRRITDPLLSEWQQNVIHDSTRREYLQATNVFGATLLRLPTLLRQVEDKEFDLVVVDEAARATLPELLVAVLRGRRVLLVGDHKQLPPQLERRHEEQLRLNGFRAQEIATSVFQALFTGLNDAQWPPLPAELRHTLDTQYRMHPSIARIVSQTFYSGKLKTGKLSSRQLPMENLDLYGRALWWDLPGQPVDLGVETEVAGSRRWINQAQLEGTLSLLRNLNDALERHGRAGDKPLTLAIICAYKEQTRQTLKAVQALQQAGKLAALEHAQIKIDTVDAFQGQERDIIIYVYTRLARDTGWLRNRQRLNVAFSRARRLLVVIGGRTGNLDIGPLQGRGYLFAGLGKPYKRLRND